MGNYSDGDHEDHNRVKAVMAREPANTSVSEDISHNDIKLAEHVSNNFIENPTLLLAKNNESFCDQNINNNLSNLDSSHERTGEIPGESKRDHFHSDKAVATPVLRENFCAEDEPCESFAFEKFQYTIPTPKQVISDRLVATSIMVVQNIHNHESGKLLRVLFDTGGDRTMINRSALPRGVNPMALDKKARMVTLAGTYESGGEVMLKGLRLPEFDKSRNIEEQRALVFNAPCRYDVILGNDFINKVGIDIKGSNATVEWLGNSIPMRAPPTPGEEEDFNAYAESLYIEVEKDWLGFDPYESYASQILDAKYEKSNLEEIAAAQTHLTQDQRNDLKNLLKNMRNYSVEN